MDYLNGEREKQQTIDFVKFCREWIAAATIKGAANYTSAANALVRFIGKEELDIKLITANFLESLVVYTVFFISIFSVYYLFSLILLIITYIRL